MANVPVETREEMLACIPSLRAFATSLVGTRDRADDLVQEALMKAWANIGSFKTGTTSCFRRSPLESTIAASLALLPKKT